MRLAALLAKGVSGDPEAIPAARALSMATLHGARALGLEEQIGSIEVGKRADLVAVDLDAAETSPAHNVVSHLVYSASRRQVSDVWVDGRRVLCQGHLETIDEGRVVRESEQWRKRLASTRTGGITGAQP